VREGDRGSFRIRRLDLVHDVKLVRALSSSFFGIPALKSLHLPFAELTILVQGIQMT
jgi:hypothetical protein